MNRLTKRNSELETANSSLEQQSNEMSNQKRDIEFAESEKSNKVREMEKQLKQTRLEKDDFSRDLTDAQGRNNPIELDILSNKRRVAKYVQDLIKWHCDLVSRYILLSDLSTLIRKPGSMGNLPTSGKAETAVQGAEGRRLAEEAGHVRVHRGDGQAVGAATAEAEAFEDGAGQGGGN